MIRQFASAALTSVFLSALLLSSAAPAAESLQQVLKRRGLTQENLLSAAKTYVPTGGREEFIVFSSGGQSGHVIVYGIPSMRILKYIAVFSPEPWQGYGFEDESKVVLNQGRINGRDITWGDTHHPAASETNGDYDGQFLFINDKANPRLAVIDLHDFETKQIVVNPIFQSEHGGAFVSENTEYVIEAAQYAAPLGGAYSPPSGAGYWAVSMTYSVFGVTMAAPWSHSISSLVTICVVTKSFKLITAMRGLALSLTNRYSPS